jgi:hypothetical protein
MCSAVDTLSRAIALLLTFFVALQIMVGACATADNFMYKFGMLCG